MIDERIKSLRAQMAQIGVDAWIVTGTDPHQSEYVAPRWRTREFISGFTGSAGTVVITQNEALLWVDSRYFIQGAQQIEGTEYKLMKLDTEGTPDPWKWLSENMQKGSKVGVDGTSISIETFEKNSALLKKKGVELVSTPDLLLPLWKDRPEVPCTKIYKMKDEYAGFTASAKINFVKIKLRQQGADWTFISSIDDIAWLTNLRANDIPCNPVFVAFAFVSLDKAVLFVDKRRFDDALLEEVSKDY